MQAQGLTAAIELSEARIQGDLRLLKQSHDLQPVPAAEQRGFLASDHAAKMLDHGGERLMAADAWRKHITDSVAGHQCATLVFGLNLDSAVVDFELLVLVQIVPHCHL